MALIQKYMLVKIEAKKKYDKGDERFECINGEMGTEQKSKQQQQSHVRNKISSEFNIRVNCQKITERKMLTLFEL